MYNSFPIMVQRTGGSYEEIPFPDSWNEAPVKDSQTFKTEDGSIRKIQIRARRLKISASFTVTNRWLKKFEQYQYDKTIKVKVYDADSSSYLEHTMFIDDESFRADLVTASRYASGTDGLWKVSFDLEEI